MFFLPFWLQLFLLYGWIPVLILVVIGLLQRGRATSQREQLDLVARYLGGLLHRQKLTPDEHQRLCRLLEEDYLRVRQSAPAVPDVSSPTTPRRMTSTQGPDAELDVVEAEVVEPAADNATTEPTISTPDREVSETQPLASAPSAPSTHVEAEIPAPTPSRPTPSRPTLSRPTLSRPTPSRPTTSTLPWEDPPEYQEPAPRTSWAEFLQGFMQENNIRWGEVLSGMLIVGSAVGLVISLRHELQQAVPYFPALLFLLVTAAIHGAGAYTLKKWKLHGTSRGVLLIGLLLIPLNFFTAGVLMGNPDQQSVTPTIYWSTLALGTVIFAALTHASCSMLFRPPVHWWVAASLIGISLWQFPLHDGLSSYVDSSSGITGNGLTDNGLPGSVSPFVIQMFALPPAVMFLLGIGGVWRANRLDPAGDEAGPEVSIMAWGLTSFAYVTTGAMLVVALRSLPLSIMSMSPILLPAFGIGWTLVGGSIHRDAAGRGWQPILGLALSLVGTAWMLSSLLAAWPSPHYVLIAAVVSSGAGMALSRQLSLPWLFPTALGQAAVGFVVAWHLLLERFGPIAMGQTELSWSLLISPRIAAGLTAYAAILAVIGYRLASRAIPESENPRRHSIYLASLFSAILSAALAMVGGALASTGTELGTSAAVLLLNGLLALTAGGVFERRSLLRFGAGLLLIGILFALQSQPRLWPTWELGGQLIPFRILVAGMFVLFTAFPAVIVGCLRVVPGVSEEIANRLRISATELAASSAVVSLGSCLLVLPLGDLSMGWLAAGLLAVSLSLGIVWWQTAARDVYMSLQLSVIATSMVLATAVWFEFDLEAVWDAPFHLALQLVVLSALLLSTNGVHAFRRQPLSTANLSSTTGERTFAMLLLASLFVLAIFVCLPGISAEFGGTWRDTDRGAWLVDLLSERLLGVAWGLTLAASVCGYRAGDRRLYGSGILLLATTGLLLIAAQFEQSASTASAARWLTASTLLVGLGICLAIRHRGGPGQVRAEDDRHGDDLLYATSRERLWLGIGLGSLPTLFLMIVALGYGSLGFHFAGPSDPWFFGRLTPEANYGIPLLLGLAAILLAAWHERERWFARAGFVGLVTLVCVWLPAGIFLPHVPNRAEWIIGYSHASAMVLAFYGWGWVTLERKLVGEQSSPWQLPWLQAFLAVAFGTSLIPPLLALLFLLFPANEWQGVVEPISRPSGWLAFALAGTLVGLVYWSRSAAEWRLLITAVQGFVLALLGLGAATMASRWPDDPRLVYLLLMFGFLVIAALWLTWESCGAAWRMLAERSEAPPQADLLGTGTALALLGTLLAAHQWTLESLEPAFWLLTALGCLLVLATWSVWAFASVFACFGGLGILGAIYFLRNHSSMAGIDLSAAGWTNVTVAAMAAYATVVLVLEIVIRRDESGGPSLRDSIRLPPPARWLLVVFGLFFVCGDVLLALLSSSGEAVPPAASRRLLPAPWGPIALGCIGLLAAASLWDSRQRGRLVLFYLWGLAVIGFLPTLWWGGGTALVALLLAVTAYHGLISRLLRRLPELIRAAGAVHLSDARPLLEHSVTRWSPVVLTATMLAAALAAFPVLSFELRSDRVLAALVPVLAAFAWGSLVPLHAGGMQRRVASGAILCFSFACLLMSLADVPGGIAEPVWLRRLLRIVLVGALLTVLYGAVASRLLWMETIWRQALAQMTKFMAAVAGSSLLLLVMVEMGLKQAGYPLQLSDVEATVVAASLLVMIVGLIVAALAPGQLRLQVSDVTREAYVYLAEGVAGLLGVHVLLTMPWLVRPEWRPFWPYGLLAFAFAGVGASEVCRRRGLEVLTRPLLRTGALLPVVPILLMWFLPAGSDYALVLIGGGLLYFVLAATQSRPLYAAAGAVCGNVALWTLFQRHESLEFLRHPQLWLIPPAVSLLVAIQLAPRALSAAQKSLLRYLCILVIYVSSTSEIFIAGLGEAIWPPMVLIILSLLGVLLGVALQVRAFLVLGSLFVFISLVSMVTHAQRSLDHVWPWWAFGIGLGIGILTVLGIFEKKRPELLATLERLRRWD
jgi:hypothetical protein